MYIYCLYMHFLDLASTKSCYSPNWRVRNLFGEYEFEVTRHFGEYEFSLMSNPELRFIFLKLFYMCIIVYHTKLKIFQLIHQELSKLIKKNKVQTQSNKEMYQRMLGTEKKEIEKKVMWRRIVV